MASLENMYYYLKEYEVPVFTLTQTCEILINNKLI